MAIHVTHGHVLSAKAADDLTEKLFVLALYRVVLRSQPLTMTSMCCNKVYGQGLP